MRKSSIVLAFIALVSLAGSTVLGQVVEGIAVGPDVPSPSGGPYLGSGGNLINFDDVEAPCHFIDTVALTNEYAAQGVIFSGPGGNNGGHDWTSAAIFLCPVTARPISWPSTRPPRWPTEAFPRDRRR